MYSTVHIIGVKKYHIQGVRYIDRKFYGSDRRRHSEPVYPYMYTLIQSLADFEISAFWYFCVFTYFFNGIQNGTTQQSIHRIIIEVLNNIQYIFVSIRNKKYTNLSFITLTEK